MLRKNWSDVNFWEMAADVSLLKRFPWRHLNFPVTFTKLRIGPNVDKVVLRDQSISRLAQQQEICVRISCYFWSSFDGLSLGLWLLYCALPYLGYRKNIMHIFGTSHRVISYLQQPSVSVRHGTRKFTTGPPVIFALYHLKVKNTESQVMWDFNRVKDYFEVLTCVSH